MKTQTETVDIAGQSIVVRELTMDEIRALLGLTKPKEIKPEQLPIAKTRIDWSFIDWRPRRWLESMFFGWFVRLVNWFRRGLAKLLHWFWSRLIDGKASGDAAEVLGEAWAAALVDRALSLNGINRDYLNAMSTITESVLLDASPSEIELLVASVKRLNAFFFDKLVPDFAAIRSQTLSALWQPSSELAMSTPGATPGASSNPQ